MDMYNIEGWYRYDKPQHKLLKVDQEFVGRFLHDPDIRRPTKKQPFNIPHGEILDPFKPATIEGFMGETVLRFKKVYGDYSDTVTYELQRRGNLWVGTWRSQEGKTGTTELEVRLRRKNVSEYAFHLPRHLADGNHSPRA